jgi:hypothetical protein
VCPTNNKNSLVLFKHDNKENVYDNRNLQSDRNFSSSNSKNTGGSYKKLKINTTLSINNRKGEILSCKQINSVQKTETFINEIRTILDNM